MKKYNIFRGRFNFFELFAEWIKNAKTDKDGYKYVMEFFMRSKYEQNNIKNININTHTHTHTHTHI